VSVIGVDYGTRRIGIALSDSWELATPHSVLKGGNDEEVTEKLTRIGKELDAELFVIGIPSGNRRDASSIIGRYERLAELLRQKSCKEVVLWDEAFSTTEAASNRRAAGKNWRRYKEEIDKEAAAVILQSFLDDRKRRKSSAE
jgi:putative holliday junction resolvase